VDSLVAYIEGHKFTPSEMREMVMFACIKYEQMHPRPGYFTLFSDPPGRSRSWLEREYMDMRNWDTELLRPVDDKGPYYARNYTPTARPLYVHDILNTPESTVEEKVNFTRNWGQYGNEALPIYNIIAYAKNRKLNCFLSWLVKNHYIDEKEDT